MVGDDLTHVRAATGPNRVAIRCVNVTKSYGSNHVLRAVDLEIPLGQKVAVIGRSGSGKTTLLRLLITLERPDAGTIEIFGELLGQRLVNGRLVRDLTEHERTVRGQLGMVFQHFNLFPHMRVLENIVEAPVHVLGLPRAEAEADGRALLDRVGLREKERAFPRELSGGQRQRVAIARALAMHPRIMLFDEVTSALDPELVGEVLTVIGQLAQSSEMTIVVVTHEMGFARAMADRVIFMEDGQVVEDAAPGVIFSSPSNERTRAFLRAVLERGLMSNALPGDPVRAPAGELDGLNGGLK